MNEQNEELRVLMRRNLELTRENNKLLKKMHRSMLLGGIMRLIWWAILIGVPVALYYYIAQPYFHQVSSSIHDFQNGVQGAGDRLRNIPILGNLFADFLNGMRGTSTGP